MLGSAPIAVASALDKFNDSLEDDFWCAVQLGQYHWEQSQFFGSPGYATESASVRVDESDRAMADAVAADIAAARKILKTLDAAPWHQLAEAALRIPRSGHILALVIQFDQAWLHCSNPLGSDGEIYALNEDDLSFFASHEDRFDELSGSAELVRCSGPSDSSIATVSSVARAQFGNSVQSPAAAKELSMLMRKFSSALRGGLLGTPSEPASTGTVRIAIEIPPHSAESARYQWPNRPRRWSAAMSSVAVENIYYNRNHANIARSAAPRVPGAARYLESLELYRFESLEAAVKAVDGEAIRDLFEAATGIDTFDDNEMKFLANGLESYIFYKERLYRSTPDGIDVEPADMTLARCESFRRWVEQLEGVFRQRHAQFR